MNLKISLIILVLVFSQGALAKEIRQTKPENVGMSSERLLRMETLNQSYVDEGKLAGVLTMIARKGKIIHIDTAGTMGVENTTAITEKTLFRIYSMTKPITAVALMMLYEEGAFQLSDPVGKFLPEFANLTIWTAAGDIKTNGPMTMRHLLTHTSGLSYGFNPKEPVDQLYQEEFKSIPKDLAEYAQVMAKLPLKFEPGERWHYSMASDVLGAVAEKISGQRFDQLLKQRIFDPLGMADTFFDVPADKVERLVDNHYWNPQHNQLAKLPIGGVVNPSTSDVTLFLGGQGLVSTIGDYMKFAEMLRKGGEFAGKRLLSPKTIEFMTQNHLNAVTRVTSSGESPAIGLESSGLESSGLQGSSPGTGFGLGFGILTDPIEAGVLASKGSYFWGGAAGTLFWIDPEEELVGIAMMQLMGSPWPFRQEMMVLSYQAITE